MPIMYSQVTNETNGVESVTIFHDGVPLTVESSHVSYPRILELLHEDAERGGVDIEEIVNLTRPLDTVMSELQNISDNVFLRGNRLFFGDIEVTGVLANHLMDLFKQGSTLEYQYMAKFLEKAMSNPGKKTSLDNLWLWIRDKRLTITWDGNFIAYKGVRHSEGKYYSIHSGSAFVNGKLHTGYIPNAVGDVISMARNNVEDDTKIGCGIGLHAGTWDYAKGFSRGAVLAVSIDPKDVVSVPRDANYQKLRVCRYKVASLIEREYQERTWKE